MYWALQMNAAEEEHVPMGRHLVVKVCKCGLELLVEDHVVFKDEHARLCCSAGLVDDREVTLQTAVCPWRARPRRGYGQMPTIQRRKTLHCHDPMHGKLLLHLFPAIWSTIQVDAHFVRKNAIEGCGMAHLHLPSSCIVLG